MSMFTEDRLRVLAFIIFLIFSFPLVAQLKTEELIIGQWVEVYPEGTRCPFAAYQYHSNGKMDAAVVMCSDIDVLAANYTSNWSVSNGVLKLELIRADAEFEKLISDALKVTHYQIVTLDEVKIELKDLDTGDVFIYVRSK